MLSVTYAQTALRVEQEKIRTNLISFQEYMQARCKNSVYCAQHTFEQLLYKIKHLHLNCRWRRLEVHVLPEIRNVTRNADLLLAELESLRFLGLDLYRSIRDQLRMAAKGDALRVPDLYETMELYCQTLHILLAKEEDELFSAALKAIPDDRWFSIAEKFMQQDKEMLELGPVEQAAPEYNPDPQQWSSRLSIQGVESNSSCLPSPDCHSASSSGGSVDHHSFLRSAGGHGKFIAQTTCNYC
jgi:hypothetical protein